MVPKYVVVCRGEDAKDGVESTLVEHENSLIVDGEVIKKPFVELPWNVRDQNVYVWLDARCAGWLWKLGRVKGPQAATLQPVRAPGR